jgi:hypothetical protein
LRNREAGEVRKKEGELAGGTSGRRKRKEKEKKGRAGRWHAGSFTWNEEKNKERKDGGLNREIAAAWHQRLGAEFFFFLFFLTSIYFSSIYFLSFIFVIS